MDHTERDRRIYQEWLEGAPMRDIAERWQVEKETVRRIVCSVKSSSFFDFTLSSTKTNNTHEAAGLAPVTQDERKP